MASLLLLSRILIAMTIMNVAMASWSDDGSVVHLFDDDFDAFLEVNPDFFAMFYAPWCGHCKSMKPDYAEASSVLHGLMNMVAVDCTAATETCKKYNVEGYPSLKYFSNGVPESYNEGRDASDLIAFLKPKAEMKLLADVDESTDFSKLKVKQLKKLLADRGQKCTGCTDKSEYVQLVRDTIHLPKGEIPKYDKPLPKRTWAQERRAKEARKAADAGWENNGAVIHWTDDDWSEKRIQMKKPFLLALVTDWCGHCKALKPELATASSELEEDVPVVVINCEQNPETCTEVVVNGYPTLKWVDGENIEDINVDRTSKAIVRFALRKIGHEIEIPAFVNNPVWEGDNVNVLHVGDDHWDSILKEKEKVLAFAYAPWCGHCKNAKPEFTAASAVSDEVGVSFIALDCTGDASSICSRYHVTGYPTIIYFSPDGPIDGEPYQRGREEAEFVDFVRSKTISKKDEL